MKKYLLLLPLIPSPVASSSYTGGNPINLVPVEVSGYEEPLCKSPNNVFTARIDLFAGELGYFVFEECGLDVFNPTIAMEVGETYTFVQKHRSNFYHRTLDIPCGNSGDPILYELTHLSHSLQPSALLTVRTATKS